MKTFASFDGVGIAFEDEGAGRAALLLHGFLANGANNYVTPGIAAAIQAKGYRTIIPDLRAHGASDKPLEASAYPQDVLAMDQEALLAHLQITDYVLVGYSLGARTAVRMLARGAKPTKCVLAGMGGEGIIDARGRSAEFEDLIRNGANSRDPQQAQLVAGMIKRNGMSREGALHIMDQQVSTPPDVLAKLAIPILVVSGDKDEDNGSAEGLAALLPNAVVKRVPGTHMSAVREPLLAQAIAGFLS